MGRSLQVDLQLNIDNARRQLNSFSSDAQKAFKSQGQNSPAYQQAAQQAAQQRVVYRDALSQQSAFNKSLQDEAKLRQQNMQAAQRAQQQSARQYSPAAQTLAGALPGGNILGSGLSAGGMAALAGASVVAAGIAAVGAEFNKLGDRAQELASTAGNASSQLGQLRSAIERNSISTDINATSPGVVGFQKFTQDIGTNIGDFISHAGSDQASRTKAVQEKIAGGLGQGNEDWRRLKEQGVDMQTDIGLAQTAMQVKYQRQARDFDLSQRKFQVDTANQVFDLQKQASRQQFDQQIAVQKFQENFANQQSKKSFDLSQQYAQQGYQIQRQRATQDYQIQKQRSQQDFGISLSDKSYDFGVSKQRATQDYSISRSDKAYDFNLSQSRNQTEFNVSQDRSLTSRRNQLQDMALGGASGLDYLRAARDFNQQQMYAKQDFARQQQYAQQDYSVSTGRGQRDFNLGQGRNQADFNLSNQRDIRNFGISQQRGAQDYSLSQQRGAQDFGISQQQAMAARQLELESQEYARKYEGLELQTQINRQTQDLATSFQRLQQSIGFQKEGFANQASDMAYDKKLDYSNFNLQTGRQLRNYGYAQDDFAGQARSKDPLGALGLSMQDPAFAKALAANAQQSGQTSLSSQVQGAMNQSDNSPGAKAGEAVQEAKGFFDWDNMVKAWNDVLKTKSTLDGIVAAKNGGSPNALKQVQPVQTGNKTYNFDAGMSQQDQQNIQAIVDKGDAKTANDIMEYLRKQYGG